MIITYIDSFIKSLGIILCIGYSFLKIINHKESFKFKRILLLISILIISIIECILKIYLSTLFSLIITYFIYSIILSIFSKNSFTYSLLVALLSIAITYITFFISAIIILIPITVSNIMADTNPITILLIVCLNIILIHRFFKLKRLKNGFSFIKLKAKDNYFDIFILIISAIIIYMFFMFGNYYKIHPQYLFFEYIISAIIMLTVLQKTFILYQKHKLLEKTLKEYEEEIKEKDEKIDKLLKEESQLIKTNHEFYHRQEALKHKLTSLKEIDSKNFNEEYGEIIERIDQLTDEYKKQVEDSKALHKLPKTDIPEIDDMFSYFHSECYKNNIEFVLKVNGNIHSLINNIIPKNRLETLIGDLIRNSIIAINYSNKEYRSITAILGIKENFYEFCVYDSGIEFQKETLLKLGLEKATTHKDNGGTGIGYITTFETLNSCQASLIINELEPDKNNYTKSIIIRFDGKKEYIINTYRFSEFSLIATSRPGIIVRNIESL